MENELREKIVVEGAEAAAAKLGNLATVAGRVASAFHGLGEVAAVAGGIAGAWQIAEGVRDVDRLYQAVLRVKDMTGMAADHAHAMFDMFELSGIEMEVGERIITSMTRQGQKLEDGLAGAGAGASRLTQMMASMGIKTKDGPEDRILAMSKAAQQGKLDIAELIMAFNIPRSQASAMMSMLKQGPERLKAIQQDTMKGADSIDDRTLESYRTMLQVRRELKDAWGDLIGTFYKGLIPAITEALKAIKRGFEDIQPIATAIGKFLSDHMTAVVAMTKTYLALLVASKAINMFAGEKMGVFGRGKQVVSGALGFFEKNRAAAGAMDFFEARAANPGLGMFEKVGGGMFGSIGKLAAGIGPAFLGLGNAITGFLPALIAAGPVLLLLIAVVGAVVAAIRIVQTNFFGLGDRLKEVFGPLFDHLSNIGSKLVEAFGKLWNALKPLFAALGVVLVSQLMIFAWWLGKLAWLIEKTIDVAMHTPGMMLLSKFGDLFADKDDAADAVKDGARGTGAIPKGGTYQDFRGSKFEIMNNFPPGIDGGRVAVAFGDEMAKLGERRLDSGVRPLFSYR